MPYFLIGKFRVYENPQDSQPYPSYDPTDRITQTQAINCPFPISVFFSIVMMSLCFMMQSFAESGRFDHCASLKPHCL